MSAKNLCEWCIKTSEQIDSIEYAMENQAEGIVEDFVRGLDIHLHDTGFAAIAVRQEIRNYKGIFLKGNKC